MTQKRILGVQLTDRVTNVGGVQKLLTEYGCQIKTRIGLHDVNENYCSPNGIMILELFGDETLCDQLQEKLAAVNGANVQEMVFEIG